MSDILTTQALSSELDRRVAEEMASGIYSTVDELFRAAFVALDEIHCRHAALKHEIEKRLANAGAGRPIDRQEFFREMRQKYAQTKE